LSEAAATARAHPDGIIDLSIGTPVDPTPEVAQRALAEHSDAPGYPTAAGLPALREAWARWATRTLSASAHESMVAPLSGSKELVAWLPTVYGVGEGSLVAIPELAYPTYEVGALISGARCVTYRDVDSVPADADIVWVNSPGNPTGRVIDESEMRAIIEKCRANGALVVSDECYIELGWEAEPVSALAVCDGDPSGIITVQSLSKRSNLAGYRSAAAIGDPALIADLVSLRKHTGGLLPTPVQHASVAALDDTEHAVAQKEIYRRRRAALKAAVEGAGFTVEDSQAGLYLWSTRGEDCMRTVTWLAQRGVLVAPGDFYGPAGKHHVRIALTATDERIAQVAQRLS
jgi:succinyldiaminopimelate transaminase